MAVSEKTTVPQFESIVHDTQVRIRAYIAGMGISPHEVDDVAQDVYLELYKNFAKIPPDVAVERWIKGIARNLCLNHIRRHARRGRLHREALVEILGNIDAGLEKTGEQTTMSDALDGCCEKLPEKSRRYLQLKYTQDLSSQRIAELTNSSPEAVRVALHRVRAILKDCITHTLASQS